MASEQSIHQRVAERINEEVWPLTRSPLPKILAVLSEEYEPLLKAAESLARAIGHSMNCSFRGCDCGNASTLAEKLTDYQRELSKKGLI